MTRADDVLPLAAPPPAVAAAERLRLGALLERVGREDNKRSMVGLLLISGVASLALSCVSLLAGKWLVYVAIALFAYGVVALIWSVKTMVKPTPHRFLYEGGVVQEAGKKVTAVQWSDIATLEMQYFGQGAMFSGKLKGYSMRLRSGGEFYLPSADVLDLRGPFEHRMLELIAAAGVQATQRIL